MELCPFPFQNQITWSYVHCLLNHGKQLCWQSINSYQFMLATAHDRHYIQYMRIQNKHSLNKWQNSADFHWFLKLMNSGPSECWEFQVFEKITRFKKENIVKNMANVFSYFYVFPILYAAQSPLAFRGHIVEDYELELILWLQWP